MISRVFHLFGWRGIYAVYFPVYWTQRIDGDNPISLRDNNTHCFFGTYSQWLICFGYTTSKD